jgi:hypothetical protein
MFLSGVVRPREERGQAEVDDPERRLILVIFGSYGEMKMMISAECAMGDKKKKWN